MNRKIISLAFFTGLSGSVLLGQALADQQKKQQQQEQQNPPNQAPQKQSPPVAGKTTLGVSVAETEMIATGWRVSKLVGSDVVNDAGEKIGKVDDIIVSGNGSLSVSVLDIGGFLGMGAHRVAVPVRQFTLTNGDKSGMPKIILPGATKDALKSLPEFKYSN